MTVMTKPLSVAVTHRGNVGPGISKYARAKVLAVLEDVRGPVLDAHIVLDWHRDPAVHRPALAEVSVDLNGTQIRAMSVRPTMQEAIDEMEGRLERRIRRFEDHELLRHRHAASIARGDQRRQKVPMDRPVEDREIVRYKAHPDVALTPDDATYEMELLDHDFYLFHDVETGGPALLRRVDPHTYEVDALPPTLTEAQARSRLDVGGEPLVFYVDRESGEAKVLYLRYDGHYGSISLAKRPEAAH